MPKAFHRPSSFVARLALAACLLAAALPVAAGAEAGIPAAGTPAAKATPSLAAPAGTPGAVGSGTPGVPLTTTAPASPTITLTAPPAISVTPAPTPTATPPAIYPPVPKTSGVPRFERGPCTITLPPGAVDGKNVKCGTLTVREEHADPQSPTIQLAVAIVPASGPRPVADPIIFNQGGPGFGSIDTYLSIMLASPFRQTRDLIAFDQRGTGYSNPTLLCPEVTDWTIATLNKNLSIADSDAQYNVAVLACRDRLVHAGVNLSAYNTQESAADVEDLRQALGYQQLNLYGVSYGSLLVLDTLRFFPASVRSAVVDGVVPPQGNMNTDAPRSEDRAFTEVFNACAADTNCNTTYPKLSDTFYNLVAQLNTTPAHIHIVDPENLKTYSALLNGDGLIGAVFQAMYESDLIPAIPEIIRRATQGDYTALEPIVSLIDLDRTWSVGMYWSVYCAEDADFDPAKISYTGIRPELAKGQDDNNKAIKSLCQAWNVRDLAPVLNTPVTSTVPTLLLNGRFDPITPPANGLLASQTLSLSTVITVPTTAHGAFPAGGSCINDIMGGFIDSPGLAVDSRCLANLPAITFDTPNNMVAFSIVDVSNALAARSPTLLLGLLGLVLATLALLSAIVLFPISWILKQRGKPPDDADGAMGGAGADPAAMAAMAGGAAAAFSAPPQVDAGMVVGLAPWLAILAGLLPIAFAAALFYTVGPLVQKNSGVLLLGLPGSLTWVFVLPLANALIVVLLVVASFLGLFKKDWSGRRKLYLLFLSLAGIILVVALGFLGLLTALWPQVYALVRGLIPL